jgi:uncharacterized membrane protein YidH (DUF202 family)
MGGNKEGRDRDMSNDMLITLSALAVVLGVAAFARWRGRQRSEPLKVRLVNYHYVFIVCMVGLFIIAAHLLTLIAGHPLTGGRLGVH